MTQSSLWQPSDIMSAEAGNEPEAPKRRGRIPQSAWPHILERHRAGATLSAIAREFDCTPSAISYIVRKAEASGMEPAASPEKPEPEKPVNGESVAGPEDSESEESATAAPQAPQPATQDQPDQPVAQGEPPAPTPAVATAPATEVQPAPEQPVRETAEPRSVERRAPPVEGRPQLRASDLGRLSQPAPRVAEPAPASPSEQRASSPASAPVTEPARAPEAPKAAAPSGRAEPAPPVDAVEARLRDTARSCLVAYRGWKQTPGENSIQTLHDAVHELRKALARIEIDMSASRRDEQVNRPIPIPAHRAARRPR